MTQRIELSETEVTSALQIVCRIKPGNVNDADILLNSIIDDNNLTAELPEGFNLKQFQQ